MDRLFSRKIWCKITSQEYEWFLLLSSKKVIPGHVGSQANGPENGVSSERDSERNSSFSDSRRLKNQKTKNLDFGGDKTDTPTDMLHKEAQVAFKILMTH